MNIIYVKEIRRIHVHTFFWWWLETTAFDCNWIIRSMGQRLNRWKKKKRKKRIHMHFFFFIIEKHITHNQLKLIHYILRHTFTLITSMINSNHLQAGQIQRKLQSKQFILIKNEKNVKHVSQGGRKHLSYIVSLIMLKV